MASKIILNLAISLDGFIADEAGGYDWIQPAGEPALNTAAVWTHEAFLQGVSAVVMGKRSFDQGLHTDYGAKDVYVATHQNLADRDNIHFIGGDICRRVQEIREKAPGNVYLFGGGLVIDPLLKAGLVDEYVIGIIPIILGRGIPLFLPGGPAIPLQLTHYYVEDGVVVLRYVPRGDG